MMLHRKNGLKRSETLILPLDGRVPVRKPKAITHVVYQSVRDFIRSVNKCHSSWHKAVHLVFDAPVELSEYTIPQQDFSTPADIHVYGFVDKEPSLEFTDTTVERSGFNIIEEAVKEVKAQATILNQLMTFIYSLPRATHQTAVKESVCQWMMLKYPVSKVEAMIAKTPEAVLNQKQLTRLRELLTSEVAQLYRRALQEGGDSEHLARKYEISAYEINYMRAVVSK